MITYRLKKFKFYWYIFHDDEKDFTAVVVLFIVSIGCKKVFVEPLCACSPVHYPGFSLALKNANGADLLDPNVVGSFSKEKVKLFQKDAAGVVKQIQFYVNRPLNYDGAKFPYHQLISDEIIYLAKTTKSTFYLQLGDNDPAQLTLDVNHITSVLEKLVVNSKEATRQTIGLEKYPSPIFSFTL